MEKEPWEIEFDEKFVSVGPIKDFIRTQREQAITDYLKGEGAQQYIAEIKEQAKRDGYMEAVEAIEPGWMPWGSFSLTEQIQRKLKSKLNN